MRAPLRARCAEEDPGEERDPQQHARGGRARTATARAPSRRRRPRSRDARGGEPPSEHHQPDHDHDPQQSRPTSPPAGRAGQPGNPTPRERRPPARCAPRAGLAGVSDTPDRFPVAISRERVSRTTTAARAASIQTALAMSMPPPCREDPAQRNVPGVLPAARAPNAGHLPAHAADLSTAGVRPRRRRRGRCSAGPERRRRGPHRPRWPRLEWLSLIYSSRALARSGSSRAPSAMASMDCCNGLRRRRHGQPAVPRLGRHPAPRPSCSPRRPRHHSTSRSCATSVRRRRAWSPAPGVGPPDSSAAWFQMLSATSMRAAGHLLRGRRRAILSTTAGGAYRVAVRARPGRVRHGRDVVHPPGAWQGLHERRRPGSGG